MSDTLEWHRLIVILILLILIMFTTGCCMPLADCIWDATGEAWVDENANGIWDEGEPPLEGVEFHVDDILNGHADVGRATSDWDGKANISVWLPGCPKARFEVYAEPPSSYRLTTDVRLPVEGTGYGDSGPFRFGFALLPGFPTPTPYTRSLQCKAYNQEARDIGISPDGSVWAVSWDGVSQYNPTSDVWHSYEVDVPDTPRLFDDIAVGSDGVIWIIASDRLMARFAESNWTTYTEEKKLIPGSDPSIGTTPDGIVWLVLRGADLVGFNPETDSWKLYCGEWSSHCSAGYTAKAITDGSVWFGSSGGWSEYGPPDAVGSVKWKVSDRHTFAADEIKEMPIAGWIEDAEIAPDGKLWIVYSYGVTSFDPQTEQWQIYDSGTTNGILSNPIQDLAVAPDGSVWMASSRAGHSLAYRFIPEYEGSEQDAWRTFDPRDGIPDFSEINNIAVGIDGSVWFGFAYEDTIAQCELIER